MHIIKIKRTIWTQSYKTINVKKRNTVWYLGSIFETILAQKLYHLLHLQLLVINLSVEFLSQGFRSSALKLIALP